MKKFYSIDSSSLLNKFACFSTWTIISQENKSSLSLKSCDVLSLKYCDDLKPLKTVINGIIFNKLKDEIWIDFSTLATEIDCKKAYESIQLFFLNIQKIDSKGFLNTTDLNRIPVIAEFIKYFTKAEEYISGDKVVDSYKWLFNILMVCLYEYSEKIMYKMEKDFGLDSDLLADLKEISKDIFGRIDPSIRIKFQKRGISIIQNIYTGFDTEYKSKDIKYNDLISVQMAVNTKTLLKVPKYSKYELSTLNTLTGEEYKIDMNLEKDFNYHMVEKTLNRSINEVRSLTYKKNDASISILIEGLQRLNVPFIEKDDVFVFSFPRTPIQPFIYYNKGVGYTFKDMINQANIIGEPYLNIDYERIIDLLKRISSLKIFNNNEGEDKHLDWIEKANEEKANEENAKDYKVLDIIEDKNIPEEVAKVKVKVKVKKITRSSSTVFTEDKVNVTKIRNNYFIAHLTNADLSIMNDFDEFKEELNIVQNNFVTLGKPIVIENTHIIIRDTMLLAPQGHKSLESIGSLYGDAFKKVNIAEDLSAKQAEELTKDLTKDQKENLNLNLNLYIKENMDLLLKVNKELFDSYAIKDAVIPLIHSNYMEDFNFELKEIGIPVTLSSLGSSFVKEKWRSMGYKGYQISPKYLLGDVSATQTPKGLLSTSKTGLKISFYIGNYKGGRNESFMYGRDIETLWFDYDLTSAYTTGMALLGNPDYNKGRLLTFKELEKMSFEEILYSYIIMTVKFKFKSETKFPSIPVYMDETTTVYPLEGEGILTGAEYLLAKNQKCDLKISEIYYIPFEKVNKDNKGKGNGKGKFINQPFKDIIKEIQSKRRQYPKGSINNLLYKEMGNSIYGAVVRGMSDKRKFDIKTGRTLRMEASSLSNPVIASWITGFVRSLIGECLEKISKLNGKVVSVTTDGYITNIENLELKLIGKKAYFINMLKTLELKTIEFNSFLHTNFLHTNFLHTNFLVDEVNYFKKFKEEFKLLRSLNFDLIEEVKKVISELKWEGDDSLLKEYEKIRLELSGDYAGLEIKKAGKGITSWTTRGQFSKESGIKATTGFQSKNYTLDELDDLFKDILKKEDKSLEYIQFSLRSALDIYKDGGHVTAVYKDQIFRLQYDNRRIIIIPKEHENTIDFSSILLDSNPVPNKDFCKNLRYLSKLHKQRLYNKHTSTSSGNKYKSYIELAVRNYIKGLLSNPQKYNLNTEVSSYSEIIDFVKVFDGNIKVSKASISNLKGRKMIFKTVPRTKETLKFVDYIKRKHKDFNEGEFFKE